MPVNLVPKPPASVTATAAWPMLSCCAALAGAPATVANGDGDGLRRPFGGVGTPRVALDARVQALEVTQ